MAALRHGTGYSWGTPPSARRAPAVCGCRPTCHSLSLVTSEPGGPRVESVTAVQSPSRWRSPRTCECSAPKRPCVPPATGDAPNCCLCAGWGFSASAGRRRGARGRNSVPPRLTAGGPVSVGEGAVDVGSPQGSGSTHFVSGTAVSQLPLPTPGRLAWVCESLSVSCNGFHCAARAEAGGHPEPWRQNHSHW